MPRELASRGHSCGPCLAAGMLRHVVHGVVIDSAVPDSTALRAAALARVCPQGSVVCDVTAAWLHGVDIQAER